MSNSIIVCDQEINIGCRVIKWNESGGFTFYSSKKYSGRNVNLDQLRQNIKISVLQSTNTYTAKQAYIGLISRGSSVNFIIDDDNQNGFATIYQCLDIKNAGLSHAPLNKMGPAIQLTYHSTASTMMQAYSFSNQLKLKVKNHKIIKDKVHGKEIDVFCPTEAQVNSCIALLSGMIKLFPHLLPHFPHDSEGKIIKTFVPKLELYSGLLCNYHISYSKTDPLGVPVEQIEQYLSRAAENFS